MKESEIRPQATFARYLELVRQDGARLLQSSAEFVLVPCPGCGAEGEQAFEKEGYRYKLCAECGSLFVSPRPSWQLLDRYYRESEAVKFWETHFYRETAEARREKVFRPRVEEISSFVRDGLVQPRILADIGAGFGLFLEEVARLGIFPTLLGVEPAPNLATVCREKGFRILETYVERVPAGAIMADVATAYEVLEHVFDPVDFLRAAAAVVAPGGCLYFTTLSVSGFDIQVLWEYSKSVSPPQHLNLLSLDGIRRAVERSGLQLERLTTPGQLDLDIVRNTARENPQIKLPRFVQRLLGAGPACDGEFQALLQRHRLSSHVRVLARPKEKEITA